ncbi:hypothetical protein [Marinicella gelatinilytica]|uniref:hypothetical protein n=1 Tax=Marinicella gelatinilytica TaxID=2996017 RepID=UPI002260EBAA|nr:hypothetical protein [Marinicella gelatinilytica]MCX7545208.1 hypothetical protein [Marinicella gelatinilytica]
MKIKISEDYYDIAAEWQYQMIVILKETLKKKGIAGEKAKDIIGDFTFDFAMLHNQAEIRVQGKSYNPRISFDDFQGRLITTEEETNLHEYAFGNTSEAFGE